MYNSNEISTLIKSLAKEKKISIGKMLADCDLNKNTLSSMQSGGFLPRLETIVKIAEYLDCSVDYLIGKSETLHTINQVNTGNVGDNSNVNISKPTSDEKDEMTTELIKAFNSLSFREKLDVLNLVIKKSEETF